MKRAVPQGSVLLWLVAVASVVVVIVILQQSVSFEGGWQHKLPKVINFFPHEAKISSKRSAGVCGTPRECPAHEISFYIHSGAANVVPPAICVQNKLVLGTALNNAGGGINIVILNGKTGEVLKTDHYNMYSGDVKPFIELLKSIETGSIVIMASYDEPSTKLNDELKNLIAELGSSHIHSLGYRDNWVFVGGKGVTGKSTFEKHMKSDSATNKYDGWPELIGLEGCVPKFPE
ncbi:protein FAM3C-like [Pelmatolapia mariae]|uniref:protein FAM3C-like n=1 Tax=Pelmatolapia mariae TaxID=158779 RepID=UPI002FE6AF25